MTQNKRKLQLSVTVFLKYKNKYLFMQKNPDRWVDAGRINGIGGKVESDENFLTTALRETEEETGFKLIAAEMKFCGMLRLTGGYPQDWLVGFFAAEVDTQDLPNGGNCPEGEFLWLTPEELWKQEAELVDDLHYIFPNYIEAETPFFGFAQLNEQEKIEKIKLDQSCLELVEK